MPRRTFAVIAFLKTILLFPFIHLFFIIPSAMPITFNYSNFSSTNPDPVNKIVTKGDAILNPKGFIELTTNGVDVNLRNSTGRAMYSEPLRLWDSTSQKMADFVTHFSFLITCVNVTDCRLWGADGFAFFLVPNNSGTPPDSGGGCLGLFSNCLNSSSQNQIVAVEFDTYANEYDPIYDRLDHVGIDINSVKCVTYWNTTLNNGSTGNAWITYNSSNYNLSVFLTFANNTLIPPENPILSYVVNLRDFLPEWVTVGFSATTGQLIQLHKIYSWDFNSTDFSSVDSTTDIIPSNNSTEIQPSIPPTGIWDPQPEVKNNNIKVVIGSVVGGAVMVCGLVLIVYLLWWRKKASGKQEEEKEDDDMEMDLSMDDEFEKRTGPRRFSYCELVAATNNFAEGGKLGQGGFGGVYRGILNLRDVDLDVAVKRISKGSKQGKKEYMSEVRIISRLRHRNLVKLVGWCHERGELLLVYEYMPNGSLDFHLFRGRSVLTWAMRYKIALGLASALLYLHEEWEECVVHRDVKSSNVMLDSSFNAKLGDFGLARLADHELGLQTTVLAGTMGYLAPECVTSGKASKEGDVYSFGVVALEIACGRRAIEPKEEPDKVELVAWVRDLYASGKLIEVVDQNISMNFEEQQMERLLVVGLWCAHLNHKLRPPIKQALNVLQFEAPMPNLPLEMSMPTPSFSSSYATNSQLIGSSSTTTSSQLTTSSNVSDSTSLLHSTPR